MTRDYISPTHTPPFLVVVQILITFFYEMDNGISKKCIFSPPYQKGHVITVSMVV